MLVNVIAKTRGGVRRCSFSAAADSILPREGEHIIAVFDDGKAYEVEVERIIHTFQDSGRSIELLTQEVK